MLRDIIRGKTESLTGGVDGEIGIGGFTLFARVSDVTNYTAQVPAQVLEDGSFATDHIINDPLTLTITGTVTDRHIRLTFKPELARRVENLAGQITIFLPGRTQSQISRIRKIGQSAIDAIDRADRYLNIAKEAYGLVTGQQSAKPLREQFIDFIEAVYYGKQLIDIDAAYRTHTSMAITSLSISRNNETEMISFDLSVQKVEIAKAQYADISEYFKNPAPAFAASAGSKVDKGAQNARAGGESSLLSALVGR